ncbi:hypothetical protein ABEB36_014857 [Hypothenemus hampei]|uniref:Uncharacterized protein n=1 Tax=Hypothenemus hampei TaxID=57062 RepID=A0ABD1E1D9_HYPHA
MQKDSPERKGSSAETVSSEAESFLTGLATSGRARRRRKAKRKEVRTKRYRRTTDEGNLWEAEGFLRKLCQQVELLDREIPDAYRPKNELKEAAKEIVKIVEGLTTGDLGKGLQLALNARAPKRLATTSEGQGTAGKTEVAVGRLQEEGRAMKSERDGLIEERRGIQQEMARLRKKSRDLELEMEKLHKENRDLWLRMEKMGRGREENLHALPDNTTFGDYGKVASATWDEKLFTNTELRTGNITSM